MDVETIWEEYGFGQLQNEMDRLFPTYDISFPELMHRLLQGDVLGVLSDYLQLGIKEMAGSTEGIKNIFVWLVVLGVMSALVGHFVEVFDKHQVADLSFYFIYLLMSTVLLKCFSQTMDLTVHVMENIVLFSRLLIPAYLMAVGVATGAMTAGTYYQFMLILLCIVQEILSGVILPLIYSYCLLAVVNGIWIEEKLTLFMEFLEKIIGGVLKASVWIVTGLSVFQSVLTPVLDSFQNTIVQKTMGALPGVGDAAEGVMKLTVGSAVVIKNSMGLGLLILLCLLCLTPLLRIGLTAFMLKAAAALMGIVSNKRITTCADQVGNGAFFLFRLAGTAMLLFLISIAIIAIATNKGL